MESQSATTARIKVRNECIDGKITDAELVAQERAIDEESLQVLPYQILSTDLEGITVRYTYDQAMKAGIYI